MSQINVILIPQSQGSLLLQSPNNPSSNFQNFPTCFQVVKCRPSNLRSKPNDFCLQIFALQTEYKMLFPRVHSNIDKPHCRSSLNRFKRRTNSLQEVPRLACNRYGCLVTRIQQVSHSSCREEHRSEDNIFQLHAHRLFQHAGHLDLPLIICNRCADQVLRTTNTLWVQSRFEYENSVEIRSMTRICVHPSVIV
ncbi:unnamed protein product [Moneuplotes crassus]|uniref:Uncharacterized protein n=1 Tax=Euplotes crassus TaxID=5936 RepID=A0AAD1XNB5_EUPCR|nr:unnamed protein product [Moneuplotes crassus]